MTESPASGSGDDGGAGLDSFELTGVPVLNRIGIANFIDFTAGRDGFTVDGQVGGQILNAGLNMTYLASGDILRFEGASSQAFWRVFGLSGSDSITGSDSGDRICTGHDTNSVLSGAGDEFVFLGVGADYGERGAGNDTIFGGGDRIPDSRSNKMLYGGTGNDFIDTASDASVAYGDDWLVTRLDRNGGLIVSGGEGADTFNLYPPPTRAGSTGRAALAGWP